MTWNPDRPEPGDAAAMYKDRGFAVGTVVELRDPPKGRHWRFVDGDQVVKAADAPKPRTAYRVESIRSSETIALAGLKYVVPADFFQVSEASYAIGDRVSHRGNVHEVVDAVTRGSRGARGAVYWLDAFPETAFSESEIIRYGYADAREWAKAANIGLDEALADLEYWEKRCADGES